MYISFQTNHGNQGYVNSVTLVLHGTKEMPNHMKLLGGRREYPEIKTQDVSL